MLDLSPQSPKHCTLYKSNGVFLSNLIGVVKVLDLSLNLLSTATYKWNGVFLSNLIGVVKVLGLSLNLLSTAPYKSNGVFLSNLTGVGAKLCPPDMEHPSFRPLKKSPPPPATDLPYTS